jgi:hypothetical protein
MPNVGQKTVRVATGTKPPQYRSCVILASTTTANIYPTYTQTTLDDRTFETIHDAGGSAVSGLKTVVVTGYNRNPGSYVPTYELLGF